MSILDILAIAILLVVYVFGLNPLMGSFFTNSISSYKEDLQVGWIIHCIFAAIGIVLWAVYHVSKMTNL